MPPLRKKSFQLGEGLRLKLITNSLPRRVAGWR